jgi:phosphatidate cytidylyltransferase
MPFLAMVYMHEHTELKAWLILLIMSVCVFDTGAFLAGNLWGRTKLAPTISPNKTYEGILGGFCSVLITMAYVTKYFPTFHALALFKWSLYISSAATCGDLFESCLKRNAGIKDSGSILPGHGGLLDRFDSIIGTLCIGISILLFYNVY